MDEKKQSAHQQKRAAIKAKATKGPGGGLLYRIGAEGHYRDGRMYSQGELIELPESEEPSVTWEAVAPKGEAASSAPSASAPVAQAGKRPSDRSVT